MTRNYFSLLLALILFASFTSDKPAYQLYDIKGKQVKYKELVAEALKADVVLFGELHNNPVCHWLQLELTRDMHAGLGSALVLGAEMFEADNQLIMDELMEGKVRLKDFVNEARLWPNFKTDYQPLVKFAEENKLKFVATNVPRRYAAMVSRGGFNMLDSLTDEARKWLAPLPIAYDSTLSGYSQMMKMMGSDHVNPNLPKAQALKDATMAWFIFQNMKNGKKFLHFNGTYHSDNFQGISWYLKLLKPDIRIISIASVSVADPSEPDDSMKDIANFVLAIHERMTTTY